MTMTQQALLDMWTENTGRNFLDSGGAYGRNWERNQGLTVADMLARPQVTLDARWFVDITVSAFHWLDSFLEYDDYMQRVFEKFANAEKRSGDAWLENMEEFANLANDMSWSHGERAMTWNTYNGESWLDATLQYVYWTHRDGTEYILIQYHGGCDVRGGYTKPRAFRNNGGESMMIELATEGRVSLYCSEHDGQELGLGLDGEMVRDAIHAWDSDSSGTEWTTYGGEFVQPDFQTVTPDEGDPFVACPECGAALSVDVQFGH